MICYRNIMNMYWEKYKNRNKSQDTISNSQDAMVPNSIILDHISSLQAKINSLEDKVFDLNCKMADVNRFEKDIKYKIQPLFEKIDMFEKSIELNNELECKLSRYQRESSEKLENFESKIFYELEDSKNRLSENLSEEINQIHGKIKDLSALKRETKKSSVKFDEESSDLNRKMDEFHKWQIKIEKILIICAEKLKRPEIKSSKKSECIGSIEDHIQCIESQITKFKKFKNKISEKLIELEEFSKKICKRVITIENNQSTLPESKSKLNTSKCKRKTPSKIKITENYSETISNNHIENLEEKPKKITVRSASPASDRVSNRKHSMANKLDQMYQDLMNS